MTDGQLANVEHFDSKAEVEEYIRAIPTSKLAVATFFMPAFFMQNIKGMIRPSPQDGVPTFAQPWDLEKTHVPLLDSKVDTGNYVAGILAAPEEEMHHRNIQGTSDWYVNPFASANEALNDQFLGKHPRALSKL